MRRIRRLLGVAVFVLMSCSADDQSNLLRQDRIDILTIAVPCLPSDLNKSVAMGTSEDIYLDMKFIVYRIDVYRCWLELQPGYQYTGTMSIPTTYVTIYYPSDLYAIDGQNSNVGFVQPKNLYARYEVYSSDAISNGRVFIDYVESIDMGNGITLNVYKPKELGAVSNSLQLEHLYGVSYYPASCSIDTWSEATNSILTNHYDIRFRNSVSAISNNGWLDGMTDYYAMYRALEDKYYPTSGTVHLTIEGWTNLY